MPTTTPRRTTTTETTSPTTTARSRPSTSSTTTSVAPPRTVLDGPTFVSADGGEPTRPPTPPLPSDVAGGWVSVRDGWTADLMTADVRAVHCRVVGWDDPGGEQPRYQWIIGSTRADRPLSSDRPALRITVSRDASATRAGEVTLSDRIKVELVDDEEQDLFSGEASGSAGHVDVSEDRRRISFAGVTVVSPELAYSRYAEVAWVSVTGSASCDESMPDLGPPPPPPD